MATPAATGTTSACSTVWKQWPAGNFPEEFLTLNASIGGWMKAVDMQQEGSPFLPPHHGELRPLERPQSEVFSEDPLNTCPRTEGSVKSHAGRV